MHNLYAARNINLTCTGSALNALKALFDRKLINAVRSVNPGNKLTQNKGK